MTAIAIEKYDIKGFPAPRPITSETQNEHYMEVLYSLERRGHLSASEEKYAELHIRPGRSCCAMIVPVRQFPVSHRIDDRR
jgi:hypothetical protein